MQLHNLQLHFHFVTLLVVALQIYPFVMDLFCIPIISLLMKNCDVDKSEHIANTTALVSICTNSFNDTTVKMSTKRMSAMVTAYATQLPNYNAAVQKHCWRINGAYYHTTSNSHVADNL
jgi:hypothetical protein